MGNAHPLCMPDQEFEALTSSIYAGLFNWEGKGYSLKDIPSHAVPQATRPRPAIILHLECASNYNLIV